MKLIKTEKKDNIDKKQIERKLYGKFFKRLTNEKGKVVAIFILMLLSSLLYTAIPFVLKEGVQKLYLIQDFHRILFYAVGLIIAFAVISVIKEKVLVEYTMKFVAELKKDFFSGILRKTSNKFANIRTGKVLAYLSYNISLVKSLISEWGSTFVQQSLNFVALFIATFFIDSRLVMLFLAVFPVFFLYLFIIQLIVRKYALNLMTLNKQIFQNAEETLGSFAEVKASAIEDIKARSFNRLVNKDLDVRIERNLIYRYNKVILHAVSMLLVIVFIAVGGKYLNMQELTFSEFIFFVLYIHLLFRPFEITLLMSSYYEAGKIGIKTVFPYVSNEKLSRISKENLSGKIEIRGVTYKNSRSPFKLKKIKLDIESGEKISILGDNSSGKGVFVEMLMAFRRPVSGEVLFDSKSYKELGARTLRKNISVVSENFLLSTGTIFHFLSSGGKKKTKGFDEKLIYLCNELKLNEKILGLDSRKFQAKIYGDDIRFSTSEKIKLALVKAVYGDCPILILDNFWHSFDENNRKLVEKFIKNHCKLKTVIQLSSKNDFLIEKTDNSYLLVNGKLKVA